MSANMPLLVRKIAPQLSSLLRWEGCINAALYFHFLPMGATLRQRWEISVLKAMWEEAGDIRLEVSIDPLLRALQHFPLRLGDPCSRESLFLMEADCRESMSKLLAALPENTVACGVSLHQAPQGDFMTVSRCSFGSAPVLVTFPLPLDGGECAERGGGRAQMLLKEIESIFEGMERCFSNMEEEGAACMGKFWQVQRRLDRRMAHVLHELDSTWIGHWRHLMLGAPCDTGTRKRLQRRAADLVANFLRAPAGLQGFGALVEITKTLVSGLSVLSGAAVRLMVEQLQSIAGVAADKELLLEKIQQANRAVFAEGAGYQRLGLTSGSHTDWLAFKPA
ncbi:unnamed protein product [Ostreobium quekettii]|uniref:Uncharacterized protein n=1 Tax=Ostreobium quekettii TaxID=121088 RepID=A0A8S1JHA0_9CHLO|nr:unnamed protein product [Ostreobium quekettii]